MKADLKEDVLGFLDIAAKYARKGDFYMARFWFIFAVRQFQRDKRSWRRIVAEVA